MKNEIHESEVWREGDWRCERWRVSGRPQVRLYLSDHLVSDLLDGPKLDLQRQIAMWLTAVRADRAART
jgi:hypothetical protein